MEGVIHDDRVAAVTLTGSPRAGRAVGRAAGEALKPCVLELGGRDAFVVLDDADLDRAVEVGVASRTQNNGQSCIAAKRFILHEAIAEAFTERFVAAMEALVVGPPEAPETDLGPLAREDLREALHDQVRRTQAEGAELLAGGEVPSGDGWFYPPTVLGGVTERMLPFREELFGPVASLTVARSEEEAVRLANATPFGLGGAVFTQDLARGERVARADGLWRRLRQRDDEEPPGAALRRDQGLWRGPRAGAAGHPLVRQPEDALDRRVAARRGFARGPAWPSFR